MQRFTDIICSDIWKKATKKRNRFYSLFESHSQWQRVISFRITLSSCYFQSQLFIHLTVSYGSMFVFPGFCYFWHRSGCCEWTLWLFVLQISDPLSKQLGKSLPKLEARGPTKRKWKTQKRGLTINNKIILSWCIYIYIYICIYHCIL